METRGTMISRISSKTRHIPWGHPKINKKTLRRLTMDFYLGGETLYKKSYEGTLLRYLDDVEAKGVKEIYGKRFDMSIWSARKYYN